MNNERISVSDWNAFPLQPVWSQFYGMANSDNGDVVMRGYTHYPRVPAYALDATNRMSLRVDFTPECLDYDLPTAWCDQIDYDTNFHPFVLGRELIIIRLHIYNQPFSDDDVYQVGKILDYIYHEVLADVIEDAPESEAADDAT